jgi:hypothetical protein
VDEQMPCPKVKGRRSRVSPAMPEQVLNGGPDAGQSPNVKGRRLRASG